VLVTDFGLSRIAAPAPWDPTAGGVREPLTLHKTLAGSLVGTPAFMAPELFAGRPADERSDVFAFGVALYEALFGMRPYEGGTLEALAASLARGEPRQPPTTSVPRWVRRVVLGAVTTDRDRRTPSMRALVDTLGRDPGRALLRWSLPIGLALVVGAGVFGAWWLQGAPGRACAEGAARAAAVWDGAAREAVARAFAATGAAFAGEALERAADELDGWEASWRAERGEACAATHDRGEQSEDLLERRLGCLDDRLGELAALVDTLRTADEGVVRKAAEAAAGLPEPAICGEVERLRARVPPPADPRRAAAVAEAEALRAEAQAAYLAGRLGAGLEIATRALAAAEATDYAPSIAAALGVRGFAAFLDGDLAAARDDLDRGLRVAFAAADDRLIAETATHVAVVLSRLETDVRDAERMHDIAAGALERIGGDPKLATELARSRGMLYLRVRDAPRALAALTEARRLVEGQGDAPARAIVLDDLASALQVAGRVDEAIEAFQEAIAISERAQGPRHPVTINIRSNFANCLTVAARYDRAAEILSALVPVAEEVLEPDHFNLAIMRHMLGLALGNVGRYDEGMAAHRAALAVEERRFADEPSNLFYPLLAVVETELLEGDTEAARADLLRAWRVGGGALEGNPTLQASLIVQLARTFLDEGDLATAQRLLAFADAAALAAGEGGRDAAVASLLVGCRARMREAGRALPLCRAALRHSQAALPPGDPRLVPILGALADSLVAAGAHAEARDVVERALTLTERHGYDTLGLVELRATLSRALAVDDPERADALAQELERALVGRAEPRARRLAADLAARRGAHDR